MRHNKSARDLEKEVSRIYDIQALWHRNRDLGMISNANSQVGLEKSTELQSNNSVYFIPSLFSILCGYSPPFIKQQIHKNQQVEALKELTKLLKLITKQEKEYRDRLSPYSNFIVDI